MVRRAQGAVPIIVCRREVRSATGWVRSIGRRRYLVKPFDPTSWLRESSGYPPRKLAKKGAIGVRRCGLRSAQTGKPRSMVNGFRYGRARPRCSRDAAARRRACLSGMLLSGIYGFGR